MFAHKTVRQVADHLAEIVGKLKKKPAVIGHSFGGLLAFANAVSEEEAKTLYEQLAVRRRVADTALAFIKRFVS